MLFSIVNEEELIQSPLSHGHELESASSTGSVPRELLQATTYCGVIYYMENGVEDLIIFAAAKKLDVLVQV